MLCGLVEILLVYVLRVEILLVDVLWVDILLVDVLCCTVDIPKQLRLYNWLVVERLRMAISQTADSGSDGSVPYNQPNHY